MSTYFYTCWLTVSPFRMYLWFNIPLISKNTINIAFTSDRDCRAFLGLGEPGFFHRNDWNLVSGSCPYSQISSSAIAFDNKSWSSARDCFKAWQIITRFFFCSMFRSFGINFAAPLFIARTSVTTRWHVPKESPDSALNSWSVFLLSRLSISYICSFASLVSDDKGLSLLSSSSTPVCPWTVYTIWKLSLYSKHKGMLHHNSGFSSCFG